MEETLKDVYPLGINTSIKGNRRILREKVLQLIISHAICETEPADLFEHIFYRQFNFGDEEPENNESNDESAPKRLLKPEELLDLEGDYPIIWKDEDVEFGKEAWNLFGPFACGGFDGPDYWDSLIEKAKKSPYYKKNIIFHVSGRGYAGYANPSKEINKTDCYTWAPYILHKFSKAENDLLKSHDERFRWIFYEGINYARKVNKRAKEAQEKGVELSIYEINHHLTAGNAPDDAKNLINTSTAAGISLINSMLIHMKENYIRNQCFFTFSGNYYSIRLWGGMLNMQKGKERYRPTWLACGTANKVIMGDLMETTHSGDNPTFVPLSMKKTKANKKQGIKAEIKLVEEKPLPVLHSYAFKNGKEQGLVVINIDTTKARNINIEFIGDVTEGAKSWLLTSKNITDNNEPEHEAQVHVTEQEIKEFTNKAKFTIPPFSMKVFRWSVK